MDCLALGDEIAVRLARESVCIASASTGRTAFDQAAIMRDVKASRVFISLGNHPTRYIEPNLFVDMDYVRSRVTADVVVWVLPASEHARDAVRRVAAKYRDVILEVRQQP